MERIENILTSRPNKKINPGPENSPKQTRPIRRKDNVHLQKSASNAKIHRSLQRGFHPNIGFRSSHCIEEILVKKRVEEKIA